MYKGLGTGRKGKMFSVTFEIRTDTHLTDSESKIIRSQWGYVCYFSNYCSQSRGVAILINNNFEFKFHSVEKDNAGNLSSVHCVISN